MPQPDPQTLVRSTSVPTGETAVNVDGNGNEACKPDADIPPTDYCPAESFYLSKEDELDWFDRNAFYERKDSTKGNSNNHPNSTSQRFSFTLKSKPSIIGLPKTQKTNFTVDGKFRRNCKPVKNPQFFPKRSRWSGRNNLPLSEPSSPKVSCIGRVRSKRDRKMMHRRREAAASPSVVVRGGFWKKLKTALGLGRRKTRVVDTDPESKVVEESVPGKTGSSGDPVVEIGVGPPGLGGLKRFASGRRSESWGGGGDVDLGESESDTPERGDSVLGRRGVGPLSMVDCGREWEVVGPASV